MSGERERGLKRAANRSPGENAQSHIGRAGGKSRQILLQEPVPDENSLCMYLSRVAFSCVSFFHKSSILVVTSTAQVPSKEGEVEADPATH